MILPDQKQRLLDEVCEALRAVPNIAALALGGSHARGTARADSDLDIGLYYFPDKPFAIGAIRGVARRFCTHGEPTVADFYEWGPFVNGGAWIENNTCKIDFLYRNTAQLAGTIAEAEDGIWTHSFDQQPPFGFRSVVSLGEIHCCKVLHDPYVWLAAQKKRVAKYPSKLRQRIVQDMLWGAEFSFFFAEKFSRYGDVPNTVACMTRIFHYLVQALFALNECYFVNDKRIAAELAGFRHTPPDFFGRAGEVLAHSGRTVAALDTSLRKMEVLFHETVLLADGAYAPRFQPKGHDKTP